MGRRRPIDRVNWRLYRRAWLLPGLALVVVLATSFAPERTPESPLPPSFTNEQAAELIAQAQQFSDQFPDRRPGAPGAIDAAQWVRDQLRTHGFDATTVPATTTDPQTGRSLGIANVEAVLPGRTPELVVVHARRDNRGTDEDGSGDPVGTAALLSLAQDLAATRDRRRTFMLVSTDAGALNRAGARALAERLARRSDRVVATINLDRLGSGAPWVPLAPAGRYAPPLGLAQATRDAVLAEGGDAGQPSGLGQLLRLSVPVTMFEHGQPLGRGLPAVSLSGVAESGGQAAVDASTTALGDGMRSVQRVLGTLDSVDTLQSAGKTYVSSSQRVYRGWALKILIASMLLPVWLAGADVLLRHRRSWNVAAALGTVARAGMAGLLALMTLWLASAVGLLPQGPDGPPSPAAVDAVPVLGIGFWLVAATAAWLLARGPDWRRIQPAGRDIPDIAVAVLAACVLCALMLAANPYTVLLFVPALHMWLVLCSRFAYSPLAALTVWGAGLILPASVVLMLGIAAGTGATTPIWALELVASGAVPAGVALPAAALAGIGLLVLVAAFGQVARPVLPGLRRTAAAFDASLLRRQLTGSISSLPAPARRRARSRPERALTAEQARIERRRSRAGRAAEGRSSGQSRLISR